VYMHVCVCVCVCSAAKVYCIYDVPHIIKNIRNNLMTHDLVVDDNVVSFKYLRHMFDEEQQSTLRLAPKLTKLHFDIRLFRKMNVRLAAQVLSRSSAVAIRTYVHFGRLEPSALPTADFVENINQLFDVLNSMCVSAKNKWKKPLSSTSVDQFKYLDECVAWIGRWRFVHPVTGASKASLPCQTGLQQTILGVRSAAAELLQNHSFKYVLTSRFNQDAIENFFGTVRSKGINNDTRTTVEYQSAVKHIAVNWIMEQPEQGANCLPDDDAVFNVIDELGRGHAAALETAAGNCTVSVSDEQRLLTAAAVNAVSCETSADLTVVTDWPDIFDLTDVDANIVAYICGYLCMKVNRISDCADCSSSFLSYRDSHTIASAEIQKHEIFIHFKNFDWAKHGLQKPSYAMFCLCSSVEKAVRLNIESCVNAQHGVVKQLFDVVLTTVDVYSYSLPSVCALHQLQQIRHVVLLYLRLRIHHFVRIRNRELKDLQLKQKQNVHVGKKNRKLEKISHR